MNVLETWKDRTRQLKTETLAIYLAYKDPRMPWYARLFAAVVVGYAFSPIDLIPDPIPVLGYLDDIVLVPLGVTLVLKMIPADVLAEARQRAQQMSGQEGPINKTAAVIIVALWVCLTAITVIFVARILSEGF